MKKKTCKKPLASVLLLLQSSEKRECKYGDTTKICSALECDISDIMEMVSDINNN